MDRLPAGETFETLQSADGRFQFIYQGDGNLVLYGPLGALWQSQTAGTRPGFAVLQGDGNLVAYDADERAVWASHTDGHPGAWLVVQNDGNVVIYEHDRPLWHTHTVYTETAGPAPRPPEPAGPPPAAVSPPPAGGGLVESIGPGGIREHATATATRPRFSRAQIADLLPERGGFTFPAPYNTRAVRLTNASDCSGQDGVLPCGYPYWSQINNHRGQDSLLAFVGLERRLGGQGPTLYRVDKRTLRVENLGPLFDASHPLSWAEGQGWYFSATRPTVIYLNDGPRLVRYDVVARTFETVFMLDGDRHLWQIHSSADDRVHSGTVKDAQDQDLGCVVYRDGQQRFYPKQADYDECQVDASGRWLVIKETFQRDGRGHLDNRIIDLTTGAEHMMRDEDGAAGHSDMPAGTVVGENDYHALPGALCQIDLATGLELLEYHGTAWGPGMGEVSVRGGRALVSHATRVDYPRSNELVLVPLNGSLTCTVVAPNLTDLDGVPADQEYKHAPHANLDPLGEWAMWTTNGGGRRDAFLVQLP